MECLLGIHWNSKRVHVEIYWGKWSYENYNCTYNTYKQKYDLFFEHNIQKFELNKYLQSARLLSYVTFSLIGFHLSVFLKIKAAKAASYYTQNVNNVYSN